MKTFNSDPSFMEIWLGENTGSKLGEKTLWRGSGGGGEWNERGILWRGHGKCLYLEFWTTKNIEWEK